MKKLIIKWTVWIFLLGTLIGWSCGRSRVVLGQNPAGVLVPWAPMQFQTATGVLAANGKLCSYSAGTTTPLDTYTTSALSVANTNPLVLSSSGRPQTNGIYLSAAQYKFVLYAAAATGSVCPLTGTIVWTADGVFDLAQLQTLNFATKVFDGVRQCSQFAGATAGAKLTACIADLPATGGVADMTGIQGSQVIATNVLTSITKNVTVIMSGATYDVQASLTTPSNVSLVMREGSVLSQSGGIITINGPFSCEGTCFAAVAAGEVTFGSDYNGDVNPVWFGASTSAAAATNLLALQVAIQSCKNSVRSHRLVIPPGKYDFNGGGLTTDNDHDYFVIQGSGAGIYDAGAGSPTTGTTLHYTGTGTALIVGGRGTSIRDVMITGTSTAAAGGIQFGNNVNIAGVTMSGVTVAGFVNTSASGAYMQLTRSLTGYNFYNVAFTNNYVGFKVDGTGSSGFTTWNCFGCSFSYNTTIGLSLSINIASIGLYSPLFQGNGTDGVFLESAENVMMTKPYFEGSGRLGAGFDINVQGATATTPSNFITVDSPNFGSGGAFRTSNIRVSDTRDVEIRNPQPTNYGVTPTVTYANRNMGFVVEPMFTLRQKLGSIVAHVMTMATTNAVTAFWGFDTTDQSISTSEVKDITGNSRTLTTRNSSGSAVGIGSTLTPSFMHQPASISFTGSFFFNTPDNAAFSFGNGANDTPFSVVVLAKLTDVTDTALLAKWDETTGVEQREWRFFIDSGGNLNGSMYDESADASIGRECSATVEAAGIWHTYILTKSAAVNNAAVNLYSNASNCDDADTGAGAYTAMEDLTALVGSYTTAAAGTRAQILDGQAAIVFVIPQELTAAQVRLLDMLLRGYAGLQL